MAIRFDAAADQLSRATDHPSSFSPISWCCWIYVINAQTALISGLYNTDATAFAVVGLDASNVLTLSTTTGSVTGSTLSTNTWYHVAYSRSDSDNSHWCWLNGVLDSNRTDATAITPAYQVVGSNTSNNLDGRIAAYKTWPTFLAGEGFSSEMHYYQVVTRYTNTSPHFWWPLLTHTDVVDYSGRGRDATTAGTLTTEDGPPIAWGPSRRRLALPIPQRLRPSADVTDGNWLNEVGSATNLYASIDEPAPANDSDYIESASGPSNDLVEIKLSAPTVTPDSGTELFRFRYRKNASGGSEIDLTAALYNGATLVQNFTIPSNIGSDFVLYSNLITSIPDYSDLRVRITANQVNNAAPTFVGAGTAAFGNTSGTGVTPGLPTGWAADDIHVLLVAVSNNTDIAEPSGWTKFSPSGAAENNTTVQRVELWWRRAVAGDTAPTVAAQANTVVRGARIFGVRGCPTSGDPFDVTSRLNNAASATVSTTDITSTIKNTFGLFLYAYEDDPTAASQPTNWSTFTVATSSLGTDMAIGHSTRTVTTAGSYGSPTTTVSGGTFANSPNVGILLAFKGAVVNRRAQVSWVEVEVPTGSGPASQTITTASTGQGGRAPTTTLTPGAMSLLAASSGHGIRIPTAALSIVSTMAPVTAGRDDRAQPATLAPGTALLLPPPGPPLTAPRPAIVTPGTASIAPATGGTQDRTPAAAIVGTSALLPARIRPDDRVPAATLQAATAILAAAMAPPQPSPSVSLSSVAAIIPATAGDTGRTPASALTSAVTLAPVTSSRRDQITTGAVQATVALLTAATSPPPPASPATLTSIAAITPSSAPPSATVPASALTVATSLAPATNRPQSHVPATALAPGTASLLSITAGAADHAPSVTLTPGTATVLPATGGRRDAVAASTLTPGAGLLLPVSILSGQVPAAALAAGTAILLPVSSGQTSAVSAITLAPGTGTIAIVTAGTASQVAPQALAIGASILVPATLTSGVVASGSLQAGGVTLAPPSAPHAPPVPAGALTPGVAALIVTSAGDDSRTPSAILVPGGLDLRPVSMAGGVVSAGAVAAGAAVLLPVSGGMASQVSAGALFAGLYLLPISLGAAGKGGPVSLVPGQTSIAPPSLASPPPLPTIQATGLGVSLHPASVALDGWVIAGSLALGTTPLAPTSSGDAYRASAVSLAGGTALLLPVSHASPARMSAGALTPGPMLLAPVTYGHGSYTGAGSIVAGASLLLPPSSGMAAAVAAGAISPGTAVLVPVSGAPGGLVTPGALTPGTMLLLPSTAGQSGRAPSGAIAISGLVLAPTSTGPGGLILPATLLSGATNLQIVTAGPGGRITAGSLIGLALAGVIIVGDQVIGWIALHDTPAHGLTMGDQAIGRLIIEDRTRL